MDFEQEALQAPQTNSQDKVTHATPLTEQLVQKSTEKQQQQIHNNPISSSSSFNYSQQGPSITKSPENCEKIKVTQIVLNQDHVSFNMIDNFDRVK